MNNEDIGSAGKNKTVDTNNTKGKVLIRDGVIVFDNVPIVTPNSDILVREIIVHSSIVYIILIYHSTAQGSFIYCQDRNELFDFRS